MIKSKEQKTGIEIDLTGPDGNAFFLIGTASKLARQLGLDSKVIQTEMMNGDYQLIDKREGKFKIIENSYKIGYTTGVISYKNSVILN